MTTIDLGKRHREGGWAKYLPAISTFMVSHLGKDLGDPTYTPAGRVPAGFEKGMQGINHLDPVGAYYHYPYSLYSAGHAELDPAKGPTREPMIHNRDRENTIILGDSGGFQISSGILKMPWDDFKGKEADAVRDKILRWLEDTSDWAMTLDVPPFAALGAASKRTGLTSPDQCLDLSVHNLHYFLKNRIPGKTRFLNVISGTNSENSKTWYEAIKWFSMPDAVETMGYERNRALEGWAFAGTNMRNMYTLLMRMLDLRDDNLLHDKDWIHFLGIGRLDWACHLTAIERMLRKYHNPNISLSFDASSPYVSAGGYGLVYTYNQFSADRLTYSMEKCIDNKDLKGSKLAMPFQSPIMDRLTVGDICAMGHNDLNKIGKIGKTSWDVTSYALMMAHNVYNHIHAVQEVNRLADLDHATRKGVDFRDWYIMRNSKRQTNLSTYIPNSIIFFNDFIQKLFDPANADGARAMVEEHKPFLDFISFGDKTNDLFDTHFGATVTAPDVGDDELKHIIDDEGAVDER